MKQVRFLHTADLHLDSPMVGLRHLPKRIFEKLQESTFQALRNMTDAAISHGVDFVVIAGDLYDGEDRSIRAQAAFRNEMSRLDDVGIKVFVIHGNHDYLGGHRVGLDFPGNVHFFKAELATAVFEKEDGTIVHLYGFSYPDRHVTERWIEKYDLKEGSDFHIGLLHGHMEGESSDHGRYAPFRLTELLEKGYDYWALGHIHKAAILNEQPPVVYPGNTQGRNRKEQGKKGAYIVDLTEAGAALKFFETAAVTWEETVIDGTGAGSFNDIYESCRIAVEKKRRESKGALLSIRIDGMGTELLDVKEKIDNGELLELLQEDEKDEESFVWTYRLSYVETVTVNRAELIRQSDFYQELFNTIDQYNDLDEAISTLFRHHQARRHLSGPTENEKHELLDEAEQLLLKLLLKN